ncbi:MAG: hypothetical protein K6E97_09770 [Treponema sp.]|nr:hypothetical protein [Treponema sp.]
MYEVNEITATFYYHTDHLGSASLITDYKGNEFQRIEYTPYGEVWTEKQSIINFFMPYKFTGKELDEETGLYYYGARYLDPKYSRWMSTDPALGEYLTPDKNNNYGAFDFINLNLYHYGHNNPVCYTDPDGREDVLSAFQYQKLTKIPQKSLFEGGIKADANYPILSDSEYIVSNEVATISLLLDMRKNPSNYIIGAYERKALSTKVPEYLPVLKHSLYVIYNIDKGTLYTLSFNGTKDGLIFSKGAWLVNTNSDWNSLENLADANNEWNMKLYVSFGDVNVKETVDNILISIVLPFSYYALDHIKDEIGTMNCNTALQNTLTEN